MKTQQLDVLIGLMVVAFGALLIWLAFGLPALMWVVMACVLGSLVLYLWSRESRWARGLAILLMPAILLTYLVPKNTRTATDEFQERLLKK